MKRTSIESDKYIHLEEVMVTVPESEKIVSFPFLGSMTIEFMKCGSMKILN